MPKKTTGLDQPATEPVPAVLVTVYYTPRPAKKPVWVRVYTCDPALPGNVQGYRRTFDLRDDPELARLAVVQALTMAGGHIKSARLSAIALDLEDEFEDLLARVLGLRQILLNKKNDNRKQETDDEIAEEPPPPPASA